MSKEIYVDDTALLALAGPMNQKEGLIQALEEALAQECTIFSSVIAMEKLEVVYLRYEKLAAFRNLLNEIYFLTSKIVSTDISDFRRSLDLQEAYGISRVCATHAALMLNRGCERLFSLRTEYEQIPSLLRLDF